MASNDAEEGGRKANTEVGTKGNGELGYFYVNWEVIITLDEWRNKKEKQLIIKDKYEAGSRNAFDIILTNKGVLRWWGNYA